MFLFKASRYLQELEHFQPDMLAGSRQAWQQARRDSDSPVWTRTPSLRFLPTPSTTR